MQFELMHKATENGKPIWDSVLTVIGGLAVFLQSALSLELEVWAQIFAFVGVGVFGLTRAFYWIKNDGYEESKS